MVNINLGCGPVFVGSTDWLNFDFAPAANGVAKANLLDRLQLNDRTASMVYSSHFLEHVPKSMVPVILREWLRVLQPGGVVRIVVPDLENLAREYLHMRAAGEHEKADFVVLEMIDQCVRRDTGGELGSFYRHLGVQPEANAAPMIDYIRERTGENLRASAASGQNAEGGGTSRRVLSALRRRIERIWIRLCLLALPAAFRSQNVSLAAVGECHHWLWDYHQLKAALEAAGFEAVQRRSANTSAVSDFPFQPLDLDADGRPRKGAESMYLEAQKPF